MNVELTEDAKNKLIENIKLGIMENEGFVEVIPLDRFIDGFGKFSYVYTDVGIKFSDTNDKVLSSEEVLTRLKMDGVILMFMTYPDGSKSTHVMQYDRVNEHICAFAYFA